MVEALFAGADEGPRRCCLKLGLGKMARMANGDLCLEEI